MIKVIHKKDSNKYKNVFYIGRGSELGNPYTSIKDRETKAEFIVDTKEESIEKYKEYLEECIQKKEEKVCNMLNKIYTMAIESDVYLSCYCSPRKCHGDIIKRLIEEKIESRIPQKKSQQNEGTQLNIFDEINKD